MILEVCVDSVESAVTAEADLTPVSLHRAFDMYRNLDKALDDANNLRLSSSFALSLIDTYSKTSESIIGRLLVLIELSLQSL